MSPSNDCLPDIRKGKGVGYSDEGKVCMIRCFQCGRENWAPAVASGRCAWCGYNPSTDGEPRVNETIPNHGY